MRRPTPADKTFLALIALLASSAVVARGGATTAPTVPPAGGGDPQPHKFEVASPAGPTVEYLVTEPSRPTPPEDRWAVVFLYGAGGSLKSYNLARPQYAKIRQTLGSRGAYLVVPELGRLHFMNDQAKRSLTAVIDKVVADYQIDPRHVHLMGTSMGAGSSLAYAVNFPRRVRSVCAIMPMTDFAAWVGEAPKYAEPLKAAYGGSVRDNPQAYDANSAVKHPDALKGIPVLLVHGTADRTVPVSHSDHLAAALKAKGYPCTLIRVDGAGHSDDVVTALQGQIADFLTNANREAQQP